MFRNDWCVDVIADGETLYLRDAPREEASADYDRAVVATRQIAVSDPSDDLERTVRLIDAHGTIVAESTIRWGDVLDSFDHRL